MLEKCRTHLLCSSFKAWKCFILEERECANSSAVWIGVFFWLVSRYHHRWYHHTGTRQGFCHAGDQVFQQLTSDLNPFGDIKMSSITNGSDICKERPLWVSNKTAWAETHKQKDIFMQTVQTIRSRKVKMQLLETGIFGTFDTQRIK